MTEPTSRDADQPTRELRMQFDMQCNLLAASTPDAHLIGILATLSAYHGWLETNLRQAGPIGPQQFVAWMRSAERHPDDYPEPWAARLVELFDQCIIAAVEDNNQQPGTVLDVLDDWITDSQKRVKDLHDLPEDFFQEAEL